MPPLLSFRRRVPVVVAALVVTLGAVSALGAAPAARAAQAGILPLGAADLPETSSTETLAAGVTLTRIVRGDTPALPGDIQTTPRGPWRVNVLRIDPRRAHGGLRAGYGPDLARTEKTSELVRAAGAVAGVNASFFTFSASKDYPGDPVGLGLYGGRLRSEPQADPNEVDFVVDAARNRALIGPLRWSGRVRNLFTGASLALEHLDHPPVVPAGCVPGAGCALDGDTVAFGPEFGARTPPGDGAEVVLNRLGCVIRVANSRGTALRPGQFSVQATGADVAALLHTASRGCLLRTITVSDVDGRWLPLGRSTYGVNGRYRLTADGRIVVPPGSGSFFERNPRTVAGVGADGALLLATIDGRQPASVGTTLAETAAVARALGIRDAVNLDGGGSTAMAVRGALVNQPSGSDERAVGDALMYLDR